MLTDVCDFWIEHDQRRKGDAMKTFETAIVTVVCIAAFPVMPAAAADNSKLKDATRQVESGAKTAGEGIKETAKGVGATVVEGAKTAGDKIKEAGRAAEPAAKNAWRQFKDSAASFAHSVKNFFTGLGG
jgi:hypothetical protein